MPDTYMNEYIKMSLPTQEKEHTDPPSPGPQTAAPAGESLSATRRGKVIPSGITGGDGGADAAAAGNLMKAEHPQDRGDRTTAGEDRPSLLRWTVPAHPNPDPGTGSTGLLGGGRQPQCSHPGPLLPRGRSREGEAQFPCLQKSLCRKGC